MASYAETLSSAGVIENAISLAPTLITIEVSDPEVLAELAKQPAGLPREKYAASALRLGVLALRLATGEVDSGAIREAGKDIVQDLETAIQSRGSEMTAELASALRQYFDPATGTLPRRIESLIKNDGDLERALRVHLAPENSTISRAIEKHFGEGSSLSRLLSPDDAQGFKSRIEAMLTVNYDAQKRGILKEFSLDSEDSSLSRLIRKISESNGKLTSGVENQVNDLLEEFSLDKPDSALSRLVNKVEAAQSLIGRSLTLDDETSPLSRLKRELSETIDGMVDSNSTFQIEVREALAKLQGQKAAAAQSTLHGLTFEDRLGEFLRGEATRLNDLCASTGKESGAISYCKIGDFVTTLGPDSAAPGVRIVWEAKSDKSYDLPSALKEIEQARKNRQAQVGVFVFARESAPASAEPLARHGSDLVVVWDSEDESTNIHLKAAVSLARALAIRESVESSESEQALNQIDLATRVIEKQIGYLDACKSQVDTIKNNSEKVIARIVNMRGDLAEQVELLDQQIAALKTRAGQGAEK